MSTGRRVMGGVGGVAAAGAAALAGATWYYAKRLTEPPGELWPPEPDDADRVSVTVVRPDRAALRGPASARPGTWGVVPIGAEGYLRVSRILEREGDVIWREAEIVAGDPPEGPARLDVDAWPDDLTTLPVPAEEITYQSPLGDMPAYFFPADGRTWAVCVHGRSGRRTEAFRITPTLVGAGLPAMAISYRNDPDAPRSPDNRSHLGATEWEDVEAAVRHALEHGAQDVVLVGFSMGGALCLSFVNHSPLAGRVRGMILEAPVLDWSPVLRLAARDRGLPRLVLPVLLPLAMGAARLRAGIDWEALRLSDPAELTHPKLLIHGDADTTVPVDLADALATARPDIVTYLRVPGAGHGECWNADPDRYEDTVRSFVHQIIAD